MKVYENIQRTVYECTKVICDACHEEFDEWSRINDLKISFMFTYGSPKDGRVFTANYCQECALEKVIPALQSIGDVEVERWHVI